MRAISFGDLASTYRNQISNARLKADLQRLGQELASGKISDLSKATGGDLGNYAGLVTAIQSLGAYKLAANEAATFADAVQRSLDAVQRTTSEIGPALLLAGSSGEATQIQATASDARERFASVVSMLNTKIGDRALLSGTAIDSNALADSETILADLQIAIAAETNAVGVALVVDSWFDDVGGGFETSGYLGDTTDLAPFRIGPNEETSLALRADDQSLRDVLKGYAIASLVADNALSGNQDERVALIQDSATRMLNSDYALTEMRARVGTVEARIDTTKAGNSAETAALEIARAGIVAIDPYRTVTDLQSAESQLETLYTITARLSRLSLAEFLR